MHRPGDEGQADGSGTLPTASAPTTSERQGLSSAAIRSNQGYAPGSDEARILEYVKEKGSITNAECRDLLSVGIQRACYLLRKIHRAGGLERDHTRKSAQYHLPG